MPTLHITTVMWVWMPSILWRLFISQQLGLNSSLWALNNDLSRLRSHCVQVVLWTPSTLGIQCGVEFFQRERKRSSFCSVHSRCLLFFFKASKRVAASRHSLFLLPTSESHVNCLHLALPGTQERWEVSFLRQVTSADSLLLLSVKQ